MEHKHHDIIFNVKVYGGEYTRLQIAPGRFNLTTTTNPGIRSIIDILTLIHELTDCLGIIE